MVRWDPTTHCRDKCQPGAIQLRQDLLSRYPETRDWGCYNCRTISGTDTLSLHAEGRAIDIGIVASRKQDGDEIFAWCVANAEALGLQEILWNDRIWSALRPEVRHRSGHRDHVHIGLNWDGALKRTSYFSADEPKDEPMEDNEIPYYAKDAYSWALSVGVTNHPDPNHTPTQPEILTYIHRALGEPPVKKDSAFYRFLENLGG